MNENRMICPGCGRRCDLSMPSCERGREFARTGAMPERKGFGEPPRLSPNVPGRFRHYGPASGEPGGFGGHGPDPREQHGSAPHGRKGPGAHRPPHPRGPVTESPRYQADDVNGKLLTMLRVLGHVGHRMDDRGGQGRVLALLKEEGEMTQRELTGKLGIQPGSASEILSKLENAGFLIRTPSLTDRRTADVSLTEAGAVRAEESSEREQARREAMFSALAEEEKEQLLTLMEKLYRSWEEKRDAHPRGEPGKAE